MFKIQFISADDGGISLHSNDFEYSAWKCLNKNQLACALIQYDFSGAFFTSSMDFASEEGFANDGDAKEMFYQATVIASKMKEETA
tara:strand:+ start:353 stop:610 length:258 start_codon:yes stop_codon:yes gene_type:complete